MLYHSSRKGEEGGRGKERPKGGVAQERSVIFEVFPSHNRSSSHRGTSTPGMVESRKGEEGGRTPPPIFK